MFSHARCREEVGVALELVVGSWHVRTPSLSANFDYCAGARHVASFKVGQVEELRYIPVDEITLQLIVRN